jgi:hypothetical protein
MIVTVDEIVESDSFQTQHGTLFGWKFVASDEQGNQHWLGINTKKPDGLEVGKTFDFLASGKTAGKWTLGKRADMNQQGGSRPQNRPANAQGATQSASTPAQAPKVVPTMSQAVSVLRECVAAVEGWGSDAHATTLFLGRLRGDIRRDPSPEEVAAAAAAAQEAADAAAAEAQRLADEAAARARARIPQASAAPAGYTPADLGGSDNIPF